MSDTSYRRVKGTLNIACKYKLEISWEKLARISEGEELRSREWKHLKKILKKTNKEGKFYEVFIKVPLKEKEVLFSFLVKSKIFTNLVIKETETSIVCYLNNIEIFFNKNASIAFKGNSFEDFDFVFNIQSKPLIVIDARFLKGTFKKKGDHKMVYIPEDALIIEHKGKSETFFDVSDIYEFERRYSNGHSVRKCSDYNSREFIELTLNLSDITRQGESIRFKLRGDFGDNIKIRQENNNLICSFKDFSLEVTNHGKVNFFDACGKKVASTDKGYHIEVTFEEEEVSIETLL